MHTGLVTVGYADAVNELQARWLRRGDTCNIIHAKLTFGADPVRGRNRIAAAFLQDFPDATHLLQWDDDQWPDDVDIVDGMLSSGEHLVGGPYTRKNFPVRWVHQGPFQDILDASGHKRADVIECALLGTGFTLVSRYCLEAMASKARWYTDYVPAHHGGKMRVPDLYGHVFRNINPQNGTTAEDETLLSEDYSFCVRWHDLGGRSALYLKAGLIRHAGSFVYSAENIAGAVEVKP